MRASQLLLRTLREAPADAEVASHALLVRGGYVRRLTSGVHTFLPLGVRVLRRIESIVREEYDAAGMQEMLMPVLSPLELWQESGRAELFGQEALPVLTTQGRGGTYVLGPTHEEVATITVGAEVDSYRQLPVTIYQVQTKFRDEARPRFGLLRTRELTMADAYSFDIDQDAMGVSYERAVEAYRRIFRRVGLEATAVEASSGAIGGEVNHEWMVPSVVGEDHFARCPACGYSANLEVAGGAGESEGSPAPEAAEAPGSVAAPSGSDGPGGLDDTGGLEDEGGPIRHHTPDRPGIDQVVELFAPSGLQACDFLKCLAVLDGDGRPVVILVPGDREVRLPGGWSLFDEEEFTRSPALVRGYIGPMGLQDHGVTVVADHAVGRRPGPWVTGGNEPDHHVSGAWLGRDFTVDRFGSFATVATGDPCPRCGGPIEVVRSVEAGHTFQLGLHYSRRMPGATFADERGGESPFWMGCYGIGVSRLLAVVAEEHHDDRGLCWPPELAPYRVHLLALGAGRNPEVGPAADALYRRLGEAGVEVLYDDRDLSPGVKFAEADLLGMPIRLVVGAKGLARGVVERRDRGTSEEAELAVESPVRDMAGL